MERQTLHRNVDGSSEDMGMVAGEHLHPHREFPAVLLLVLLLALHARGRSYLSLLPLLVLLDVLASGTRINPSSKNAGIRCLLQFDTAFGGSA